jgi:hypothetical protein
MMSLEIVMKYVGQDPAGVLCEHEDWDAMPHEAWVAYHSLNVLKDPEYLKFVTDKLVKYVDKNMRWASTMSAATAADIHRDCDVASPESIVETMSKLTLRQLEIVGI